MRKIGIMGGTFNPIHIAHLQIAEAAMNYADLDKVLFIPSGCSYLKDPNEIVSSADRLAMVELAIQGYPKFEVSHIEIDRPGNSYTYVTLTQLRQQYPDDLFYLIMGADNLFNVEYWLEPSIIFNSCTILATVRNDKETNELLQEINELGKKFHAKIEIFPFEKSAISSSLIREHIQKNVSIRGLVPEAIQTYIYVHHLYE